MTNITLTNATLITPTQVWTRGWLHCISGKIAALGTGAAPTSDTLIDLEEQMVLPGFIDVHVHGANGADVMDATPDALFTLSSFKVQHGVTGFLPTTLTDSHERLIAALQNIRDVGDDVPGARILGAHLEGPYLNRARAGAQNPQHIRPPLLGETRDLLDMGVIRLLSLAPDIEGTDDLLRSCVQRGITVSAAHTDATHAQMIAAIDAGLTHATHTGNAMRGIHHREIGTLGAVLSDERVRCEMIADFQHLAPEALRLFAKIVGIHRVILITDAMRAAGMPDGTYTLGDYAVHVAQGRAALADGTLAGSVLTMDQALRNFVQATGTPLAQAWRATSLNAAQSIHMGHRTGSIDIGKDADLVVLDAALRVRMTIVGGAIVYQA